MLLIIIYNIQFKMLKKHASEPWLEYIKKGTKTYEGRLNVSPWSDLKPKDKIIFFSDKNELIVEITEILKFKSFGKAWHQLREKLIPAEFNIKTEKEADNLYGAFYINSIINKEVLAIGIKVINKK